MFCGSHAGLELEAVAVTPRDRIGERLGGEAPGLALEDGVVGGRVDLIDSPVVGLAVFEQTFRIERGVRLALADQDAPRIVPAGVVDVVEDRSEVHVVRARRTRPPSSSAPRREARPSPRPRGWVVGQFGIRSLARHGVQNFFSLRARVSGRTSLRSPCQFSVRCDH